MIPALILSYYFPPLGMAGVNRPLALFRGLPACGYQPYIVTVKPIAYHAYDTSLITPNDERFIARTESLDPNRLLGILGWKRTPRAGAHAVRARFIFPDNQRLWAPFAFRAAERLIVTHNIRHIITTAPPPSTHLLGCRLARKYKLQWIADWRDLWFTAPLEEVYSSERLVARARQLREDVRRHAAQVTAVNATVGVSVNADTIIPNAADTSVCDLWDAPPPQDGVLRIGHLGSANWDGPFVTLARAVRAAIDDGLLQRDRVRIIAVGVEAPERIRHAFAQSALAACVERHPYQERRAAIATLAACDVLLVTLPDVGYGQITGSKVFDYLVSGRAILALAPQDSELGKLVLHENERLCAPNDIAGTVQSLVGLYARKVNERFASEGNPARLKVRREKYGHGALAQAFANLLNRL